MGISYVVQARLAGKKTENPVTRHSAVDRRVFWQISDATLGFQWIFRDFEPADRHCSFGRRQIPGDHPHAGRFTSTVRSEKPEDLAFGNSEHDVVDCEFRTETLRQLINVNHMGRSS